MAHELGTVINKDQVFSKVSGPVATLTTLGIGWVYEDGANGFKNAPIDGTVLAKRLWWNDKVRDNLTGLKGAKEGTFYGDGAQVIGKAEGAIVVDSAIKASEVTAQSSSAIANPTSPGGAYVQAEAVSLYAYSVKKVGFYRGHVLQIGENKVSRTDAATTETDCVFEILRN